MGTKGFSAFNEDNQPGSNRNNVQVMEMQNAIIDQEETEGVVDEFDHRSDEEKNAEGYKEIVDEWKKSIESNEQSDEDVEDDTEEVDTDTESADEDSSESGDESETEQQTEKKETGDALPVIPQVLMSRALEVGITSEEAQKMSITDLTKAVDTLSSLPAKEESETKEEPEEEDILDKIKLDPDEYEEDLVNNFNLLKEEIKKLRDDKKATEQAVAERRAIEAERSFINEFDTVLKEIDNKDLFGEGSALEIEKESEAFKNRSKFYDEVKSLGMFYHKQGKEVPSLDNLMKTVGNTLFGDKFNSKGQVGKKLDERSQSFVGKPSPRQSIDKSEPNDGSKESRKKDAINAVGDFLKKIGKK